MYRLSGQLRELSWILLHARDFQRGGSSASVDNDLAAINRYSKMLDQKWLSAGKAQNLKDLIYMMKFEGSGMVDRESQLLLKHLRAIVQGWDLADERKMQEALILFMGHDCLVSRRATGWIKS